MKPLALALLMTLAGCASTDDYCTERSKTVEGRCVSWLMEPTRQQTRQFEKRGEQGEQFDRAK